MSFDRNLFLHIIRVGALNTEPNHYDYGTAAIDWESQISEASRHGLSGLFLDGYQKVLLSGALSDERLMPRKTFLVFAGGVITGFEKSYDRYKKTISSLASFYSSHDLKMMILKGYACSLDWPIPSHRPCGDIDIWLFGKYKEADHLMSTEKGIRIDTSEHHHTAFKYGAFVVENHFDFVNVHAHRSSERIERVFKELAQDDSCFTEVGGEKIYLASPDLNALFLLRHTMAHFTGASMTFRQILDWAFYVKNHTKEINWEWFLETLEEYGMTEFYNCICAICVEDFGFEKDLFPEFSFDPVCKTKILSDTFDPGMSGRSPQEFLPRLLFKLRRYKSNSWKRRLCYPDESLLSSFALAWSHIVGPGVEE
ncbi:MAG: nucleotidyltransferase family protein [Bacteroidales bacterium]|nr:nucleotidyltransferase family protein [Bacteroidales bacterium]